MKTSYQIILFSNNKYHYMFCSNMKNAIEALLHVSSKGMISINNSKQIKIVDFWAVTI